MRRASARRKRDQVRYIEWRYGSFSLPSNASEDKLRATFEDGVLTVRVQKREEAKPRVINIQSA